MSRRDRYDLCPGILNDVVNKGLIIIIIIIMVDLSFDDTIKAMLNFSTFILNY